MVEVWVELVEDSYVVQATVYAYGEFGDAEVTGLKDLLSAELELPVSLEVTVLDAKRMEGD